VSTFGVKFLFRFSKLKRTKGDIPPMAPNLPCIDTNVDAARLEARATQLSGFPTHDANVGQAVSPAS
jgi:hypothetical protein